MIRECVERQVAAVVQLFEQNAGYLEPLEKLWIEDIISKATCVKPHVTIHESREDTANYGTDPGRWTPSRPKNEQDTEDLFCVSKSLDAANSLLLCCYDRWLWIQSAQAKRYVSQTMNGQSRESLTGRREQQKCHNDSTSQLSERTRSPIHHNHNTSSASSRAVTTSIDGSENSLYLPVGDTTDEWRQNAENALNEATTRLRAGGIVSHQRQIQKRSQETSIHRTYSTTDHQTLTSPLEMDDPAIQEYPTKSRSSPELSTHLWQTSPHSSNSRHIASIEAAYEHEMIQGPNIPREECPKYLAVYPEFHSTLHNSFDKQTVESAIHMDDSISYGMLPDKKSVYSSYHREHEAAAMSGSTQVPLPATQIAMGYRPGVAQGSISNMMEIKALPTGMSAPSLQFGLSDNKQNSRSRGRRWLEQQSYRTSSTT